MVERHTHNGIDSEQLEVQNALVGAPQAALTSADGGVLSSGGAAILSDTDSAIIANLVTRQAEIEARLQALGLIL